MVKTLLPMQGAGVQSLIRGLRSHMPRAAVREKKKLFKTSLSQKQKKLRCRVCKIRPDLSWRYPRVRSLKKKQVTVSQGNMRKAEWGGPSWVPGELRAFVCKPGGRKVKMGLEVTLKPRKG